MTTYDMQHETIQPTDRRWLAVFIGLLSMLTVTISAPEQFREGVVPLFPPVIFVLFKLAGRGLAILAIAMGLRMVCNQSSYRRSLKMMLPFLLFLCFGVCSVAWSALKTTSLMQVASFSILIGLSLLLAALWKTEEDTSRILKVCSIVLMLTSFSLITLHFVKPNLGVLTRESTGLFHSTSAGSTASLGILIVFSCWVIWGWSWSRWLIAPATAIHLSSMLLGGNRLSVGILVVIAGLLFLAVAHRALVASAIMGLVIAGVLYLCLDPHLTLMEGVKNKLESFTSQGQTSSQLSDLSGRAEMWSKMWSSYLESPWFGHGYYVSSRTGSMWVWGVGGNWTAHNMWLQLIVTTGFVGALLFLMGLTNVGGRVLLKIGGQDAVAHRMSLFVMTIAAWFFCWGLLNESIFGPVQPDSVVFSLTLGLATAIAIRHSTTSIAEAPTSSSGVDSPLPAGDSP